MARGARFKRRARARLRGRVRFGGRRGFKLDFPRGAQRSHGMSESLVSYAVSRGLTPPPPPYDDEVLGSFAATVYLHPLREGRRVPREDAYLAGAAAHRIETSQGPVSAWRWGPADGPLVGLVHGWQGHAGQMGGFAAPLVAAGFGVLAFDAPGHGDSPDAEVSVPLLARVVADLATRQGAFFGLVGHSMGAAAAAMATTLGVRPAGVVLLAPPLSQAERVERMVDRLQFTPGVAQAFVRALERKSGFRHEDVDMRVAARGADFPALLFHDPTDRSCPFRNSELIAAEWAGARIVPCPGRGHLRILSTPYVHQQTAEFFTARR